MEKEKPRLSLQDLQVSRFYGAGNDSFERKFGISDLDGLLTDFRNMVEFAWSSNTVHPDFKEDERTGRFSSFGQCAVTARLLRDVILENFPGLDISNCRGGVYSADGQVVANDHVWLEVQIENDVLLIDVAGDQEAGLGVAAPKIICSYKSSLKENGIEYRTSEVDTDDKMRSRASGSFKRYEILRRRYERIHADREYYRALLQRNVFIIAPVGAGKTELASRLKDSLPLVSVDVGKLYRMAAFLVLNDTEVNPVKPDLEAVRRQDRGEQARILGALFSKTRLLERGILEKTSLTSAGQQTTVLYDGKDITTDLNTEDVDALVALVAQSPKVRELTWKWIRQFSDTKGGVILTGHTLRDIDITKYHIIQLRVDDAIAANRVMGRDNHVSKEEALESVKVRNAMDKVSETQALLEPLRSVSKIDTTGLTLNQVKWRALTSTVRKARSIARREAHQASVELKREFFSWEINPLLTGIRVVGKGIFEDVARRWASAGITEFDISVQTMIHAAGYPVEVVWGGDLTSVQDVAECIRGGVPQRGEAFLRAIDSGAVVLNKDFVRAEAEKQAQRIAHLYATTFINTDLGVVPLPAAYMGDSNRTPFNTSGEQAVIDTKAKRSEKLAESGLEAWRVKEKVSGKSIIFRPVSREVSAAYSKGFHYLHEGRSDEFMAFGAYADGDELPFAWVSYAPVDRRYKQDMLEHMQIEPQRVLEMTRAWNCPWSPRNSMSTLFTYAHITLREVWKNQVEQGVKDKPLAGIVTAINGNLGFRANAFNGAGFIVAGLKPAGFSYLHHDDGSLDYMPRRALMQTLGLDNTSQLDGHPSAAVEQIPLLPTYEMISLFDARQQKKLAQRPIYRIDTNLYKNT